MEKYPDIIPMLSYEDGIVAMDWLCRVFGFTEQTRWVDHTGRLSHGELTMGEGVIMLASPTPLYESQRKHREYCKATDEWLQVPYVINGVLVYVDDVLSHFEKAKSLGARILSDIETGGPGTRYRAEDLEGQRWMFMERAKNQDQS